MTPRERLIEIARSFVGVTEKGGNNRGAQVEAFQRAVDGKAQREPWCAAFVQFCITQAEKETGIDCKVYRSEHCMTMWRKSPDDLRLLQPEVGCLMIWNYVGSDRGHIGLVYSVTPNKIMTIEGNTSPDEEIVREGDGVYSKVRSWNGSKTMKVAGWLRTFP